MKRSFKLMLIAAIGFFISSCEGPQGPPGFDGRDGADGQEAYTFDFENIDFTSGNGYKQLLPFPSSFSALPTDVVLVYLLWGEEDGLDIWTPIPQNIFLAEGTLQYNFDFTINDVSLFMDANFNLDLLDNEYTADWIARVVVIPAKNGSSARMEPIDYRNYYEVISAFDIPNKPIQIKNRLTRPSI